MDATAFRKLAKMAEEFEAQCDLTSTSRWENGVDRFFVCTKIGDEEAVRVYRTLLLDSDTALWNLGRECMPVRVLMLCFAAAMCETGDFAV
jgi:hypothetical protein